MSQPSYPRGVAIRVLARVLSDGKPLDEALAAVSGEVAPEMRGWLQEVCSGTLRWKGRLDAALDAIALKKKPTGWLRRALLVGAYQLVAQERTNPGRVVSETVDEVKRKEGEAPARFANAILRKVADHAEGWRRPAYPAGKPIVDQARWASQPAWVWKRLVAEQGEQKARAFAEAVLERPSLWFRARDASPQPEGLEAGGIPAAYRVTTGQLPEGGVARWPGFEEGALIVQDLSSQKLIFEALVEARSQGLGEKPKALDLCAAPGGKSVGLAWWGCEVTATDANPARMRLLRETVSRAAPGARVIEWGEVDSLPPQDLVWVDAPCTGTGIVRRHPDVRWLREERELDGLAKAQLDALSRGWQKVRPGGFLVYSVCSVLTEEGAGRLQEAALPGAGILREWSLWPQETPYGDGFQGFLIRKPG